MIINSDWHIHSKYSYDASLPLSEIAENAKKYGFKRFGITDHLNYNDNKFIGDINASAEGVKEFQKTHPEVVLGVELTPIEKPEFDHIKKTGTREGYVPPNSDKPYDIELALTREELMAKGIRYAVGATHWRVDSAGSKNMPPDLDMMIKEWYRQQMWLSCDERVTILGHQWYSGSGIWYDDFDKIPRSMKMDIAAALKENKKYAEFNTGFLFDKKVSEKFQIQYVEFIRELFEMGIPITYGSDSHGEYILNDEHLKAEKMLSEVGFKEGDFSELKEEDFWF